MIVARVPRAWRIVFVLGMCLALLPGAHVSAQSPSVTLVPPEMSADLTTPGRWEVFAGGDAGPGQLASVSGVGVDGAGVAHVGDTRNKRIQKLTPDGADAGSFPIWPGWVGFVAGIKSIVVAPNGEVVLLFTNPMAFGGPEPYYLIRYTSSGRPLVQFGRRGGAAGELGQPSGFDVAPDGTVWVAEERLHQLVAYGRDGQIVRVLGGEGTAPGQFRRPGGVGAAPDGTLWVGDTGNNRIQALTPFGAVRAIWDNTGPEYDQIASPGQIRVGRDGSVFVARDGSTFVSRSGTSHSLPPRFQKFGPDGTLLAGAWMRPDAFAVTSDGNVLMDAGSSSNISRFNSNLEAYDPLVGAGTASDAQRQLQEPTAIAFDQDDNVYVTDAKQAAILVYAPDGTFLTRRGERGYEFGQLRSPSGIAIAEDGTVYVSDFALDRVYKYSPDWRLLDVWGGYGSGPGRLHQPSHLALDTSGNVYVADRTNNRIQAFRPDGSVMMTWPETAVQAANRTIGVAVAVDVSGRVYTHAGGTTIRRLTPDGETDLVIRIAGQTNLQAAFSGVTIDKDGHLWALDWQGGKLWKVDQEGRALAVWGSSLRDQAAPGPEFQRPGTVSVDRWGRVYVADTQFGTRIWRFTPAGAP